MKWPEELHRDHGRSDKIRVCNRCKRETEQMFCPHCHVLTYPPRTPGASPKSAAGDTFDCTIWQGPNRNRGIEVSPESRERYFSKSQDMVVLHIEGRRAVAKLGPQFWKKPSVIRKAVDDAGRDQLIKFFEKHHLLPPSQSMKEKGVVDTVVFEVITPVEEFKVAVTERIDNGKDEDLD